MALAAAFEALYRWYEAPITASLSQYTRCAPGLAARAAEAPREEVVAGDGDVDALVAEFQALRRDMGLREIVPEPLQVDALHTKAAPSSCSPAARPPLPLATYERALDVLTCGGWSSRRGWRRLGNFLVALDGGAGTQQAVVRGMQQLPLLYVSLRFRWALFCGFAVLLVCILAAAAATAPLSHTEPGTTPFTVQHVAIIAGVLLFLGCAQLVFRAFTRNILGATVGANELPRMLPLLMTPLQPEFMLSYKWASCFEGVARSLAPLLPSCWLDIDTLAAGDRIPSETIDAAAHARVLVLFVTRQYLDSANCMNECMAALRYRRYPHRTFAVIREEEVEVVGAGGTGSGGAADAEALPAAHAHRLRAIFTRAGFTVCRTSRDLLEALDVHALHCETRRDVAATLSWWMAHGVPRRTPPDAGTLVVPKSMVARTWGLRQRCSLWPVRPVRGVTIGFRVLAGDGQRVAVHRVPALLETTGWAIVLLTVAIWIVFGVPAVRRAVWPSLTGGADDTGAHAWWWLHAEMAVSMAYGFLSYIATPKLDYAHLADPITYPLLVLGHLLTTHENLLLVQDSSSGSGGSLSGGAAAHAVVTTPAAAAVDVTRPLRTMTPASRVALTSTRFEIGLVASSTATPFTLRLLRSLGAFLGPDGACAHARSFNLEAMAAAGAAPGRLGLYAFILDTPAAVIAWHQLVTRPPTAGFRPWTAGCMVLAVTEGATRTTDVALHQQLRPALNALWQHLCHVYTEASAGGDDAKPSLAVTIIDSLSRKVATIFQLEKLHPTTAAEAEVEEEALRREAAMLLNIHQSRSKRILTIKNPLALVADAAAAAVPLGAPDDGVALAAATSRLGGAAAAPV